LLQNGPDLQTPSSASKTGKGFRWFQLLVLSLLALPSLQTLSSENNKNILFILSNNSGIYKRIADISEQTISAACASSPTECPTIAFKILLAEDLQEKQETTRGFKIFLGTKAANYGADRFSNEVRLNAMIPFPYHAQDESGIADKSFNIYIDQPYSRYFDLIKFTIPRAVRIGILVHENNINEISKLEELAQSKGMILKTSIVSNERNVGQALTLLLDEIDVLIALPDARIHNSKTISHILTTSYRNNIPVIGFSSAYVRAGAAAAVYTSPDNIAQHLSDLVIDYFRRAYTNDKSQMAKYFSITFNYEVARSLGLPTISTRETHKLISSGEKQ
jgi:nitrogen regulatory protein PII-like uncharacterized protein